MVSPHFTSVEEIRKTCKVHLITQWFISLVKKFTIGQTQGLHLQLSSKVQGTSFSPRFSSRSWWRENHDPGLKEYLSCRGSAKLSCLELSRAGPFYICLVPWNYKTVLQNNWEKGQIRTKTLCSQIRMQEALFISHVAMDVVALMTVVADFARIHARPADGAIIRAFLISVALYLHLRDLWGSTLIPIATFYEGSPEPVPSSPRCSETEPSCPPDDQVSDHPGMRVTQTFLQAELASVEANFNGRGWKWRRSWVWGDFMFLAWVTHWEGSKNQKSCF